MIPFSLLTRAHPRHGPARIGRRLPRLLGAGALLLALAGGACERIPSSSAPGGAGRAGGAGGAGGAGAAPGGRPFEELAPLAEIVAETRAILPRIPSDVPPPALPEGAPREAGLPAAARGVLLGEGRLLRPTAFAGLPARIRVEVFLDEDDPPGGYLLIDDGRTAGERWLLLSGYRIGRREDAFRYVFRVSDPARRLAYLTLLGVRYRIGARDFRSFEGYLVRPAPDGALSARGAIYPIDFGYRHPDPPEAVVAARALAGRIAALEALAGRWEALARRLAGQEAAAARLREVSVPAEQADRQRADLARFAGEIAGLRAERDGAGNALRTSLAAVYRERTALADAWLAFADGNDHRWRTPAERRAAYLPLRTLRATLPRLRQIHASLAGDEDASLRRAREAMGEALLREQERVPAPGA